MQSSFNQSEDSSLSIYQFNPKAPKYPINQVWRTPKTPDSKTRLRVLAWMLRKVLRVRLAEERRMEYRPVTLKETANEIPRISAEPARFLASRKAGKPCQCGYFPSLEMSLMKRG